MVTVSFWLQPAVISIIASAATSCFVAPCVVAYLNRKNAKKSQKNKALVDAISELIGKMEQINSYLFTLDGDAMDQMWSRKYRYPIVNNNFTDKHQDDLTQLNILISQTSLFWKEHEDYFNEIANSEITRFFEDYLKLVRNLTIGIHRAFDEIKEGQKQEVPYPDIPVDIFLHDASIKLGKLRWKIINQ
ncbi:hypothetical protein HMPREF0497_0954 [Lentilactobacillus buchneri ATCC 11577]|nr:hypothetical protein HMPREF0497_0954 [Lentilactobacillus buchneri ATCC 11577]